MTSCFNECLNKCVIDKGNYGLRINNKTILQDNHSEKLNAENFLIGDVIGVAINLDDKTIQFYKNGVLLGNVINNIPTGENKVYLPSILLTYKQKIHVNFGQDKFLYNYPNFQGLDLPEGQYKNSLKVSEEILQFLNANYKRFFIDLKLPKIKIYSFLCDAFQTLGISAIEDEYTIKEVLIPFLIKNPAFNDDVLLDEFFINILHSVKDPKKNDFFIRFVMSKNHIFHHF